MAVSVRWYDRMTILAELADQVLRNVRANSCTSESGRKGMLQIWFIGKR